MKRFIATMAFGAALLPLVAFAGGVFTRTLRVGDNGSDVAALQRILNKDKRTQVAMSGIGSQGQESEYFGIKTKQAVVRFQELYANEILTPSGLLSGTGFVGSKTLSKLNALVAGTTEVQASKGAVIFSLSPSSASPGQGVSAYGDGFGAQPAMVLFGKKALPLKPHPTEPNKMLFAVPADTTPGIYTVTLNFPDIGVSNTLKMRVTGGGSAALVDTGLPIITGISPRNVTYGDTITLTGKNFSTSADNIINLSYAVISGVASPDGQHLSFVVNPPIPRWNPAKYEAGAERPVWELWASVDSPKGSGELSTMSFNFTP